VAERSGDTALGNCCASSIQSGVAATALHKRKGHSHFSAYSDGYVVCFVLAMI